MGLLWGKDLDAFSPTELVGEMGPVTTAPASSLGFDIFIRDNTRPMREQPTNWTNSEICHPKVFVPFLSKGAIYFDAYYKAVIREHQKF